MCVCGGGGVGGEAGQSVVTGRAKDRQTSPANLCHQPGDAPSESLLINQKKRLSSKIKREGSGCGAGAGRAGVRGVVTGGAGSCTPPACHRAGRRCNPEADMRPDALLNG